MLLDEIVEMKKDELDQALEKVDKKELKEEQEEDFSQDLEHFIKAWEREFDRVNATAQNPPEENSDFDSDNEINPLDQLDALGRYASSKQEA